MEREREESLHYYTSVLETVIKIEREITSWIPSTQPREQSIPHELSVDPFELVCSEDSISKIDSRAPLRTRSIVSSSRSSSSMMARAAARKAALEASVYELQLEELKLQQKRAKINFTPK